jgi:hypothetical protein
MRRQTVQYDRLDLSGRKGMAQPAQIGLEPPHHDGLEAVGIRMLLNEHEMIRRDHRRIHLVGIDGAHFYRVDNIEKAAAIPHDEFSNLISHPPRGLSPSRPCAHNALTNPTFVPCCCGATLSIRNMSVRFEIHDPLHFIGRL